MASILVLAMVWLVSACADPKCPPAFVQEGQTCKRCPGGAFAVNGKCLTSEGGLAVDGDGATAEDSDAGAHSPVDARAEPVDAASLDGGTSAGAQMVADSTVGEAITEAGVGQTATDAGSAHDADTTPIVDASPPDSGSDATLPCGFECKLARGRRIAAGWRDTCVVNNAGSVYCWGNNDQGEVGDGTQAQAPLPKKVPLPGRAVEVSVKGYFACAALETGDLYCWGSNSEGQLGVALTSDRELTPRKAMAGNVVEVQAGGNFTCARQDNAVTLRCWGHGQNLGLGSSQPNSSVPLTPNVAGLAGFKAFGTSGQNTCALRTDGAIAGRVSCWGWNQFGQAGVDPMTAMWVYDPTVVNGISGARILAVGARHNCAVTGDRDVSCWGWNSVGQLGNGGGADSSAPVVVGGVELQGKIRDLFAGGTHSCAILEPNTLVCWGGNDQGQLGLGDRMARATPTRVSGISARAVQGAAGDYHTCVYLDTDDVACWGYGFYGALGTGRTDDELTPRVVVVPND